MKSVDIIIFTFSVFCGGGQTNNDSRQAQNLVEIVLLRELILQELTAV